MHTLWPATTFRIPNQEQPKLRGSKKRHPKVKVPSLRTIQYREWNIGPAHDPYGASELTVTLGDKTAVYYEDGLGRSKLKLFEGSQLVREDEHQDCFEHSDEGLRQNRQAFLKTDIMFRRHVGIDIMDAREEHDRNYVEDPIKGWM